MTFGGSADTLGFEGVLRAEKSRSGSSRGQGFSMNFHKWLPLKFLKECQTVVWLAGSGENQRFFTRMDMPRNHTEM